MASFVSVRQHGWVVHASRLDQLLLFQVEIGQWATNTALKRLLAWLFNLLAIWPLDYILICLREKYYYEQTNKRMNNECSWRLWFDISFENCNKFIQFPGSNSWMHEVTLACDDKIYRSTALWTDQWTTSQARMVTCPHISGTMVKFSTLLVLTGGTWEYNLGH